MKKHRLYVRLSEEEKEVLEVSAKARKVTVSALIRKMLRLDNGMPEVVSRNPMVPKKTKESLSPEDMPKMPSVNSPCVNLIDSTGCQSRPFLEELSAASVTHRCQGFNCKRTDTTRTEVAGCGVWLCPEHSKKG